MRRNRRWWPMFIIGLVAIATVSLAGSANASGNPLGLTPTPEPTDTPLPEPTDTPVATETSIPPEPTPTSRPSRPKPQPRLVIKKSVSPAHVPPGGQVTFKIEVCNEGNAVAEDVVVSDALPPELKLTSASASQGKVVVEGNGMRAELGSIWPGHCAKITIGARVREDVEPGTQIINVASVDDLYTEARIIIAEPVLLPETGRQLSSRAMTGLAMASCLTLLTAGLIWRRRHVTS